MFIHVLLSLFAPASFAQLPDLAPATSAEGVTISRQFQLENHRYLTAANSFTNLGPAAMIHPFYVSWFLSAVPALGCPSLRFQDVKSQSFLVGYEYVAGLPVSVQADLFVSKVDLSLATDSSGGAPSDGWYCLTSEANDDQSQAEVTFLNNGYTFETPLCYGANCREDVPKLLVYPNPASANVNLELPKSFRSGIGKISVYDQQGRLMLRIDQDLTQTNLHLDVHTFAAGSYYVVVTSDAGKLTAKLEKR